jgi:hypothetical protein
LNDLSMADTVMQAFVKFQFIELIFFVGKFSKV